ncbi:MULTISPECIES: leucyl aminopeptidase [unclassified Nitratiruptor]|uniref:leucyl aminopeptidase n=1 Tax=unclassified Nitratiruptor TaxID=2624044 RepID=UPI001916770A|nr:MULTISPECIES: leucyl aminopeptidase [unclassified Nitratiruptor]BCD60007.1 leucyl aminopeptidase [Nitratiruptor sp. YY08-10]BCD63930.1 leucyl aminopeptidase [Nitratiruptor sp. YY08-14]
MKCEIVDKKMSQIEADIEIIFVIDKNLDHKWIKDKAELELLGFKGDSEEVAFLPEKRKIYVGSKLDHDEIRIAAAKAVKTLKGKDFKTAKAGVYIQNCPITNIKAFVEGAILGDYEFKKYKSKKDSKGLEKIILANEEYSDKNFTLEKAKESIHEAKIVAKATNMVRDIVNTPPNEIYPETFAELAKEVAHSNDLEIKILDEKDLKKEGMNAFLAVARASSNPPRLVHLTYKPDNAKAKVAIVGKGLTYDSGGLSLKPSDYMVTMKADKSGASAALGIIKAAKKLGLPVEVHAILGLAENMVGGNAYKPDDVLVTKNGKTIEVRNTDAEGRLVLADCLCYAQEKIEPDYIIDMATLTGACVVALGEYTTGVMGHNDTLIESMIGAAKSSGELAGILPFNRYLPKLLESKIADICNISTSRYGGAITAALFLSEFIEEKNKDKWLHLDIAGPAYVEKEWGYNPYGASGAGVRMVIKWLQKEFVYKDLKKHPSK